MYLVTATEMRRFEAAADAGGLTYDEMMARAGRAVATAVEERLEGGRVVVLVGPGNNGGDGLVAAAHLHDSGFAVQAAIWKRKGEDALLRALKKRKVPVSRIESQADVADLRRALAQADVVVDGLLGTGASRPIEGLLGDILDTLTEVVAEEGPLVVAVDVPTGLNVDTGEVDPHSVPADVTVTFGFPKIGQFSFPGAGYLGELIIDGIGIPQFADTAELNLTTAEEVAGLLPQRPLDAHKGTFGRVLIVAGSTNFTGAAYLAAAAAYRSGAGLVTLALPGSIQTAITSLLPEATYLILPEDLGVIARSAADLVAERWGDYDAVLLGPGLSTEEPTREFLTALLTGAGLHLPHQHGPIGFAASPRERSTEQGDEERPSASDSAAASSAGSTRTPSPGTSATSDSRSAPTAPPVPQRLVVDADGLNLLSSLQGGPTLLPAGSVLTPHPGEMARLTGRSTAEINADRRGVARRSAAEWGQVVVLKGAFTVIAAPDGRVSINPFADPALATAGSGDVLSGLIAGLLGQGMEPYEAAVAGAYIHGLAGQIAGELVGSRATTATDVLEAVVDALWEIED